MLVLLAQIWVFCASENGFCAFSGTKDVRYGADSTYTQGVYTDGVACDNATFGDPLFGVEKHCDVLEEEGPPPPPPSPSVQLAGYANVWTNGIHLWAGNSGCADFGFLLQQSSPAMDQGVLIDDFHCPAPGSALSQPLLSTGDYCSEWFGNAPDIGACEMIYLPSPPGNMMVQ